MIAVPEPAPAQVADNGSIQINEEVIQVRIFLIMSAIVRSYVDRMLYS
jgi:hypothetical protein